MAEEIQDDEITLKQIVIKIGEKLSYLRSKWVVILVVGLIGAAIGFAKASMQKTLYIGTLSFTLEEEKSAGAGGLSGAMGLASQFGIDMGSSAGSLFSGDNLITLMKSRRIIERTLLQPVKIDGKDITLAEMYINFKQLRKDWVKDTGLVKVHFLPGAAVSNFTLDQVVVLNSIHEKILEESLTVGQKDKKNSVIYVDVQTESELFSKLFAEVLITEVSDFYVSTKSKKAKENVDILQNQGDSLRRLVYSGIENVASTTDNNFNLNPALKMRAVSGTKRQVEIQANTLMLTQTVQNLEMAKLTLRKETPLIQAIDLPTLPLPKKRPNKMVSSVSNFLLATILIIIYLSIYQSVVSYKRRYFTS